MMPLCDAHDSSDYHDFDSSPGSEKVGNLSNKPDSMLHYPISGFFRMAAFSLAVIGYTLGFTLVRA